MTTWKKVAVAVGFGLLMLGIGVVVGQPRPNKVSTLTSQDYIEIQQLAAKYSYALDGGLDDGKAYADLFTDDGEFHQQPSPAYPNGRVWSGRAELLTIAKKQGGATPNNLHHFIMNHVIEPTPDGAVGKLYLLTISPLVDDKNGRRTFTVTPFHYEDVYRKTPAGWRFKSRKVVEGAETIAGQAH